MTAGRGWTPPGEALSASVRSACGRAPASATVSPRRDVPGPSPSARPGHLAGPRCTSRGTPCRPSPGERPDGTARSGRDGPGQPVPVHDRRAAVPRRALREASSTSKSLVPRPCWCSSRPSSQSVLACSARTPTTATTCRAPSPARPPCRCWVSRSFRPGGRLGLRPHAVVVPRCRRTADRLRHHRAAQREPADPRRSRGVRRAEGIRARLATRRGGMCGGPQAVAHPPPRPGQPSQPGRTSPDS